MQTNQTENEILEKISAVFDGEGLPEGKLPQLDAAEREHMQHWSLIGSALRHELPEQVNLSFADKVMAEVAHTQIDLVEQPQHEVLPRRRMFSSFRKLGIVCSQLAVAASVAAVTVIGWQTYSAGSAASLDAPASAAAMGTVSGLSLASYQNDSRDMIINMNNLAQTEEQQVSRPNPELLKQMQQKELERINNYVRGYILHSAAE